MMSPQPIPKALRRLLTGTAVLSLLLASTQAAALPSINAAWDDLLTAYGRTYSQTWQEINAKLSRSLGPAAPQVQAAIQQAAGVLGIPDPNQARAILMEQAQSVLITDPTSYPAAAVGEQVHEIDREITRSRNQRISGEPGQQQRLQALRQVQSLVTATEQQTLQAQQALSTQDVLKSMSGQAVQEARLLAELIQGQAIQQDLTADTNQNASNISATLDSERRLRRFERQRRLSLIQTLTR